MRHALLAWLAGLALWLPLPANAIPIVYQVKFTALSGSITTVIQSENPDEDPLTLSSSAAGRTYFGLFSLDSDVLLNDGIARPGDLDFFFLQIEDNVWGYNLAVDNSFHGFRGPRPDDPGCQACLGAPSPGFDVVNGVITNLRGGVYGDGDEPFVDFSPGSISNDFYALGATVSVLPGTSFSYADGVWGRMRVSRVPEGSSLALAAIAACGFMLLPGILFWRRKIPM